MTLRHYFLMAALLLCGLSSTHAINRTELIKYAQTLKGKKGAELKKAMNPLLAPKTVLPYGSLKSATLLKSQSVAAQTAKNAIFLVRTDFLPCVG